MWNLSDYLKAKQFEREFKAEKIIRAQERDIELQAALKRRRVMEEDVEEMDIKFQRLRNFLFILYNYCTTLHLQIALGRLQAE